MIMMLVPRIVVNLNLVVLILLWIVMTKINVLRKNVILLLVVLSVLYPFLGTTVILKNVILLWESLILPGTVMIIILVRWIPVMKRQINVYQNPLTVMTTVSVQKIAVMKLLDFAVMKNLFVMIRINVPLIDVILSLAVIQNLLPAMIPKLVLKMHVIMGVFISLYPVKIIIFARTISAMKPLVASMILSTVMIRTVVLMMTVILCLVVSTFLWIAEITILVRLIGVILNLAVPLPLWTVMILTFVLLITAISP